ncbi:MAG: cation:proton antiporter [Spirochaetes bacterium]|nr:cation:proton antiporter [Spirochaetota bacterium]
MEFHLADNPLLILSIILISGTVLGKLVYKLKLPGVTGQILAGIILGPYVLKILSVEVIHHFEPITDFALGLIAVTIGSHLNYRKLHNSWRRLSVIILSEIILVPICVFLPLKFILNLSLPVCLILSTIALETASGTIIHLIKEKRGKGIFIKTLVSEVAINNVFCIVLFEIAHTISINYLQASSAKVLPLLFLPFIKLFSGALLGAVIGFAFIFVTRKIKLHSNFFAISLFAILLIRGLDLYLGLSPLLPDLVLGIVIGNFAPKKMNIIDSLEIMEYIIFACFFTIAGAHLDFSSLKIAGIAGICYILARGVGKIMAPTLIGWIGKFPRAITRNLGISLLPQAGMSVGLVLLLQKESIFAEHFNLISTVVLSAVLFYESIGPLLTNIGITRSGEANKDRLRLIEFIL